MGTCLQTVFHNYTGYQIYNFQIIQFINIFEKESNMKAGKIWGQTELIHKNGVLEFHRINFKAGYKCSEHTHKFKWNGFFVESGKMLVRVWQDDQEGLLDETILNAGDFTTVKPGKFHQFEGLEDGVAFELYWAEFNHDDIVRRTVGTKS